jgi:hypothetical protein
MRGLSSMFWVWSCGMLGLEVGQEMGKTRMRESLGLWLARIQVDMAQTEVCWRPVMFWF